MSRPSDRLSYLDWMRGLAVLIMIEAHVIDAWTRTADKTGLGFRNAIIVGGFGAPLFLFLAGVAVVLAAQSRRRKTGSDAAAAASVRRRGLEIFGLAFLFRLQAYLLSPGARLAGLLKVDILNIMGPSIVVAATIWELARTRARQVAAFGVATLAIAMTTPIVRVTDWLTPLPDPLEWYFRPVAGRTTFTLFPWSGFVVAGALVAVFIDPAAERRQERRLMALLGLAGAALAVVGYAMSFLPTIYAESGFWTSSPTFFLLRVGLIVATVPVVWLWGRRHALRGAPMQYSPIEEFGRSSLFVYWIHVEMVYGVISQPLHRRLSLFGSMIAMVLFGAFLFALVLIKNRLVGGSSLLTASTGHGGICTDLARLRPKPTRARYANGSGR